MLPWREQKDAYKIWISEIMLQQTRIETVKEYYRRFMEELPTVQDLANVPEERLLKLWEGLGYYTRARNLKKAAINIVKEYKGNMPKSYEQLQTLPGIGEYTAGAIASIAYNEKVPAVDGNVLRVVSRVIASKKDILKNETRKEITDLLRKSMLDQAGDFNEGLMELGETICIPNTIPNCDRCPLKELCVAKKENLTLEIPVRNPKIKRRIEEKTVFVLVQEDEIAICKRKEKGLLAGMYEFPNVEGHLLENKIQQQLEKWNIQGKRTQTLPKKKHIFSHIEWHMIGYIIEVQNKNTEFIWVKKEDLKNKYAIPGAFENYKKQVISKNSH